MQKILFIMLLCCTGLATYAAAGKEKKPLAGKKAVRPVASTGDKTLLTGCAETRHTGNTNGYNFITVTAGKKAVAKTAEMLLIEGEDDEDEEDDDGEGMGEEDKPEYPKKKRREGGGWITTTRIGNCYTTTATDAVGTVISQNTHCDGEPGNGTPGGTTTPTTTGPGGTTTDEGCVGCDTNGDGTNDPFPLPPTPEFPPLNIPPVDDPPLGNPTDGTTGNPGNPGNSPQPSTPVPNTPPKDCAGVAGGTAYKDSCGYCVGGTTGKLPCVCPTDANVEVSTDMLKEISPNGNTTIIYWIMTYMKIHMRNFGINTKLRLAHFLAQAAHETQGFTRLEERHDYSAKRLIAVFPALFDSTNANSYANCICLFDKAYGDNRNALGNGNEASKDGSKYRGSGLMHLTGRYNFTKFDTYYNNTYPLTPVNFKDNPDVVRTDYEAAVLSALWFFGVDKSSSSANTQHPHRNMLTNADNDDVKSITRLINPALNGIKERSNYLALAKKAVCL